MWLLLNPKTGGDIWYETHRQITTKPRSNDNLSEKQKQSFNTDYRLQQLVIHYRHRYQLLRIPLKSSEALICKNYGWLRYVTYDAISMGTSLRENLTSHQAVMPDGPADAPSPRLQLICKNSDSWFVM